MIVIGLVGRIGAGKSTVARRFAAHGAVVVDADRHAHEVLDDREAIGEIAARFGAGVLDGAGRVDRRRLAGIVFGSAPGQQESLEALEAIVHPRVRLRVAAAIAEERARDPAAGRRSAVVLDVPLLVQAGWDALCTHLVVVECEEAVRRARLAARGWSNEQITARDRAWERGFRLPDAGPTTWTVDASGDPSYTFEQVDRIWLAVQGPTGSPPAGPSAPAWGS